MRLLNARKLIELDAITFEEFYEEQTPSYAILSHTWVQGQEVTFQKCQSPAARAKSGFSKIVNACRLAHVHKYDYIWIDTCCIDKTSSAELSEAINSMFRWCLDAQICYVYLADHKSSREDIAHCRWFTRGWTLQELIAPDKVYFFNAWWDFIADKSRMAGNLSDITSIPFDVLGNARMLGSKSVAQKFSWASGRKTTRTEDMSYCLLGLLDINMPLLYGEGSKAFTRLQEAIVASTFDLSILAWKPSPDSWTEDLSGCLATSVLGFSRCSEVSFSPESLIREGGMSVTGIGLQLQDQSLEVYQPLSSQVSYYVLNIHCTEQLQYRKEPIFLALRKVGPDTFARYNAEVSYMTRGLDEDEVRTSRLLSKLPGVRPSRNGLSTSSGQIIAQPSGLTSARVAASLLALRKARPIPTSTLLGLIPASRFTAIRVTFGRTMSRNFSMRPEKLWELQDQAFLGTDAEGWAALRFNGCGALFLCHWTPSHEDWWFSSTLVQGDAAGAQELWNSLSSAGHRRWGLPVKWFMESMDRLSAQVPVKFPTAPAHNGVLSYTCPRIDDLSLCNGPSWEVRLELESNGPRH